VQRYTGAGCLDLFISRKQGEPAVIQEYRRLDPSDGDEKGKGYTDSKAQRLTDEADAALQQIENKLYRGRLRSHVTELREYGVAFLGPYCAVVARSMRRADDRTWVVIEPYTADEDAARCEKMYQCNDQFMHRALRNA
jgi:hypothetical protein